MNPGATSTCVSKLPASPELLAGEKLRAAHNFRCRTVRPEPPTGAADLGGIKDVDDYITKAMRSMARDPAYDFKRAEAVFRKTFDALYDSLGPECFIRQEGGRGRGGFLISVFEVLAVGLGWNVRAFTYSENWSIAPQRIRSHAWAGLCARIVESIALGSRGVASGLDIARLTGSGPPSKVHTLVCRSIWAGNFGAYSSLNPARQ